MLDNLDTYIGPAAGVATSMLWTATSLFFTSAGRRIGPTVVNAARISVAIVLLFATHRMITGLWIPEARAGQVAYLAASGVIGLSIGDQSLFTAFVYIGPRLSMLIMATAPIFATIFGWAALGETLDPIAWLGIALTIGGVSWVILERPEEKTPFDPKLRMKGIVLAFVGAACQAGGLLLSKQGIGHGWLPESEHMTPHTATFIRMVFAGMGMVPIFFIYLHRKKKNDVVRTGSRRVGFFLATCGAVVGPFLGVWMSLEASDRCPLGVAQTLCSLPPIFLLPFAALIHKEKISPRAVIGAVVAVGGSGLLFLYPR